MAKKKHYYTDRDLSINPPLYRYNHVQPGIFNRNNFFPDADWPYAPLLILETESLFPRRAYPPCYSIQTCKATGSLYGDGCHL